MHAPSPPVEAQERADKERAVVSPVTARRTVIFLDTQGTPVPAFFDVVFPGFDEKTSGSLVSRWPSSRPVTTRSMHARKMNSEHLLFSCKIKLYSPEDREQNYYASKFLYSRSTGLCTN
jgi:hypothetical protein